MEKYEIKISTTTVLKIIAILIGIYLLWRIFDIILLLLVVAIIFAALSPVVEWLNTKKIPRIISVLIIYLLVIGAIVGASFIIIPPLVNQIKELSENLPQIIERLMPSYYSVKSFYQEQSILVSFIQKPLENFSNQLAQLSINIFSSAKSFFTFLGATLTVVVLTFYLLLEKQAARKMLESILPENNKEKILMIAHKVKSKWGAWLIGQLVVMAIIGILIYLGLVILGIPFALPLAVLAGVLEIIPYLGPVFAAIPAVIIAFFVSPWLSFVVIILFVVMHLLEGYLVVPKIMQKAVGLSPIIIIIAILIGGKLAGILGVLLAVPLTAGLVVFYTEWKNLQN